MLINTIDTTHNVPKITKTYLKWLDRVLDTKKPWTENEIIYFRKYVGSSGAEEFLAKQLLTEFRRVIDSNGPFKITKKQTKKGIEWLKNYTFKQSGLLKCNKNMVFGEREALIIKNFKKFEFLGLYNASQNSYRFYTPIYNVIAKDGSSFEYTTNMGLIEVLG